MKKNILLPTDFSDNAWNAAVYALKLYADDECTFYFLHSIKMNISAMSNLSSKLLNTLKENALKEMLELKEMAQNTDANSNHDFQIIVSQNYLQQAIEDAFKKHRIDLVVIGKKGSTAAKELFLGGNTIETIKKMRLCPILIVPEEHDFTPPKQIAFPTDFNRFFDDKELRPLKNLAEMNNSKIRVVHINVEPNLNDIQEYNYTVLKSFLEDYEHSFHWMPDYANKSHEITTFIKDLEIDILVMMNYKHSFLENLLKEPVVKKIGTHPLVPFLVIPV